MDQGCGENNISVFANSEWCHFCGINSNYLVLISKTKNPRLVIEFQPISLCNVVAKTMANRFKTHLHAIIDQEHSDFVPVQLITDNILIVFATLHTIRKRRAGRKGLMAIKIDMNKSYDRVEWNFISAIMEIRFLLLLD